MPRNFRAPDIATRGTLFWLQLAGIVLAVANGTALYFFLSPPGGSRAELMAESQQIRAHIAALKASTGRVQLMASKVQTGSTQAVDFERKYFLNKRQAYDSVISEIQRMSKAAGVQEREGVFTEEPVEGSADVSVLNITTNFEGTYQNLMRFVNEADRSPMLLILDTLQAAPQQRAGQLNASIRFQAILRDDAVSFSGGQP